MADWRRYVNTTEAWAREVTGDVEDIVGSTGRTTAYRGDYIVNQNIRGQVFTYVLTADDFRQNWRTPDAVDTDTTEDDTGDASQLSVLPDDRDQDDGAESTGGENGVETGYGQVATGGARANATPADAPNDDGDAVPDSPDTATENAPPSPTASAPTSAGSGDADTPAGDPPNAPDGNPEPAMSPVSGTATPAEPVEAPAGSAASETTSADPATVDTTDPAEPATTTPTQTVEPSADTGGAGTATADEETGGVTSTTGGGGGDEGAAPTPTNDVDTDSAAEPGTNTGPAPDVGGAHAADEEPAADTETADTTEAPPDAVETVDTTDTTTTTGKRSRK
jgi:hypothetical protein